MNFVRGSFLTIGTTLLGLFIFAGVVSMSVNMAFGKPDNLKKWLAQSKIYDNVVQSVIDNSQKNQNNSVDSSGSLNLPEVQTAFKQAVSPAFLQTSTESILDGTYNWLEGKDAKPTYTIDLSPVKQAFSLNLANQANARLATLPVCPASNTPTSSADPLSITCKPPTSISDPQIQKLISDITSGGIFATQNITADTTSLTEDKEALPDAAQPLSPTLAPSATQASNDNKPSKPWYQQARQFPLIYTWTMRAPIIMAVLTVLLALGLFFAAKTKRGGAKLLSITALATGAIIALGSLSTIYATEKIGTSVSRSTDSANLQQPLKSLIHSIGSSIGHSQLWWGIGLVVLGIVGLVILAITKPKGKKDASSEPRKSADASTQARGVDKTQAVRPPQPTRPAETQPSAPPLPRAPAARPKRRPPPKIQ